MKPPKKIVVHYEILNGVFDPFEAMRGSAPQLHDFAENNICKHTKIRKGDVDAALLKADLVVKETYKTAAVEHAYLEP